MATSDLRGAGDYLHNITISVLLTHIDIKFFNKMVIVNSPVNFIKPPLIFIFFNKCMVFFVQQYFIFLVNILPMCYGSRVSSVIWILARTSSKTNLVMKQRALFTSHYSSRLEGILANNIFLTWEVGIRVYPGCWYLVIAFTYQENKYDVMNAVNTSIHM